VFSALNKIYDDVRRAELARQARMSQDAAGLAPTRARRGASFLRRALTPVSPWHLDEVAALDEPMTRERVAAGQPHG
jgi:hypothetical protein